MTFLKKIGLALITVAADLAGFAPLINKFLPARLQPVAQAVEGELTTIAGAVTQVEANAAAINAQTPGKITGADKLTAAVPLVRLAIQSSELMVGKKIKNQQLFEQAATEYTQATVDLLNSLD